MSNKLSATIKIKVRGNTESDLLDAFNEAVRKVRDGYTSGGDKNDSGSYTLDVSGDSLNDDCEPDDED